MESELPAIVFVGRHPELNDRQQWLDLMTSIPTPSMSRDARHEVVEDGEGSRGEAPGDASDAGGWHGDCVRAHRSGYTSPEAINTLWFQSRPSPARR
jgi:hypothetical protein